MKKIIVKYCSDCPFLCSAKVDGVHVGYWCKIGVFFVTVDDYVHGGFPEPCPLADD